jgi:2-oxoglutarate ferredoxin oxidoreductase subunit alpha
VVDRIAKKFETAKKWIPKPEFYQNKQTSSVGIIYFGTSMHSSVEAVDLLREDGVEVDAMRILSFPFHDEVRAFIDDHEKVIIIEQNKFGQMRTLLMNELNANPGKLYSALHYDGTPLTAENILQQIQVHFHQAIN